MTSTWADYTAAAAPCFEAAFSLTWKKLLIMSVSLALSRLLPASALVCAAVLSLFTCSASPVLTQVDNGVKPSILRSLYSPYNQNPPLYPPPETGQHAGTNRGNLQPSIIDQQLSHQQFSYDQNSPHNKQPGTAASEVWRGHRGGTRPASSRSDGPRPRGNYRPVNSDTYYNDPQVIRKDAGSPFYLLPPENAPKPHKEAKYPGVFSFKLAGDGRDWTYSDVSLLSYPSRGYWTLLTPRGRCGDSLEANGAHRTSAPSFSQRWDAFIKNSPGPEGRAASVTDVTQGRNSVSGSEARAHKKAHSYLFEDSQTSIHEGETGEKVSGEGAPRGRQTLAPRGHGSVSSSLIRVQQSHREAEDAPRPPDAVRRGYGPHYSAHTHTPTSPPTVPSTRLPPLPASDKALGSSAPARHAGSHGSSGPGSEQAVVGRPVSKAGGSVRDRKPPTNRLYGFRGFKSPTRRAGTEPPVPSEGRRFDKDSLNTTNTFMSPKPVKYSFHGASTANPEVTPTQGLKKEGAESDQDQNHRQVRVSKKIHGLEGFVSRPHEGAEASVREPDQPAALPQGLEGFELRSHTQSQSQSQDFNSKAAGSVGSVTSSRFSPDRYKKHHDGSAFLGFQPAGNRSRTQTQRNPSTDPPRGPSADLPAAGGPSLTSDPKGEAAPLHSPSSSVAKATRVTGKRRDRLHGFLSSGNDTAHAAIVRLPKWPVRVPYADIVGSASFRRVTAGEDDFTKSAATSRRERRGIASRRPEADDEEQSVEGEGGDGGMGTGAARLKGRNRPVHVQSQRLRGKPSALDHLQKSTGSVSFRSPSDERWRSWSS